MEKVDRMDERRQRKFYERVEAWAQVPPPKGSKIATRLSRPGDRYVALLTSIARKALRPHTQDPDELQSMFAHSVHMGLERLVRYWGPGRRHYQKCPVKYSASAIKSACYNTLRDKYGRDDGPDEGEFPPHE